MTCTASVIIHGSDEKLTFEGDGGGSTIDGQCWLMIKDERPVAVIPFDNILLVEYEYVDDATPEKIEYTH